MLAVPSAADIERRPLMEPPLVVLGGGQPAASIGSISSNSTFACPLAKAQAMPPTRSTDEMMRIHADRLSLLILTSLSSVAAMYHSPGGSRGRVVVQVAWSSTAFVSRDVLFLFHFA